MTTSHQFSVFIKRKLLIKLFMWNNIYSYVQYALMSDVALVQTSSKLLYLLKFVCGVISSLFVFLTVYLAETCHSWAFHRQRFSQCLTSRKTFLSFICWLGLKGCSSNVSEPPSPLYAPDRCILIPAYLLHGLSHTQPKPRATFSHCYFSLGCVEKFLLVFVSFYFFFICTILSSLLSRENHVSCSFTLQTQMQTIRFLCAGVVSLSWLYSTVLDSK